MDDAFGKTDECKVYRAYIFNIYENFTGTKVESCSRTEIIDQK